MRFSFTSVCVWSVAVALSAALSGGCRVESAPISGGEFLLVVESDIYEPLQASIEQYAETLQREGIQVHVKAWEPGTVDELKALLFEYDDLFDIEGALLVGTLPAAWYEQIAFKYHEEFPMDLYLQDRDAVWVDRDSDGIFDDHSDLSLDFYTSRLDGTLAELQEYFARVEYYRIVGQLVDVSAFIFIDDSWAYVARTGAFGLSQLYERIEMCWAIADSTTENYVSNLTGGGAEFVHQWMHSSNDWLQIQEFDEFGAVVRTKITLEEITDYNFAVSFYNLFNCSAARFDRANLAQAYTVGSDHGLASIGSTKMGSVKTPYLFHAGLAAGHSWGEAYRLWYNKVGKTNDDWHLGIVIMGDPLLRIGRALLPPSYSPSTEFRHPDELDEIMERTAEDLMLSTFEDYQERHPEFFDD